MNFFYGTDDVADSIYRRVRCADNPFTKRAKQRIERMWGTCGRFIDSNAVARARNDDFEAVWWELFLAFSLHRSGVQLAPTKDRLASGDYVGSGWPDLLARTPSVWIEAVMPKAGTGPDALAEPPDEGVFTVPASEFVLRLCMAVSQKSKKIREYMESGIIKPEDRTVIAVCGGRLPFNFQDYVVPNIVRALYAVGDIQVHIGLETNKIVGHSVQFRNHVTKKSTARVDTDFFLRQDSAHVSAVLYSPCNCCNYPRWPCDDFILVHNPNAHVPLGDDWLPAGTQYWIDAGTLRRADVERRAAKKATEM